MSVALWRQLLRKEAIRNSSICTAKQKNCSYTGMQVESDIQRRFSTCKTIHHDAIQTTKYD